MFDGDRTAQAEVLPIRAEALRYGAAANPLIAIDHLDIQSGAPLIVMGPNGAGKSLLLRLLHGLISPSQGRLTYGGQLMSQDVRRRQAMVFQRPVLLRRSVAANLHFALKVHGMARHKRNALMPALLADANLADKARQSARSLSGGEQQALAMVRAMATRPDVLFLDEPTSSLDPASTQRIETLITQAAQQGTKIIMVTHDIGQARRLAGEVLFCHRGQICEHTIAGAFFERPESRQAREYIAGKLVI